MRFVPNLMGFEPLKLSNLSFLSKQKCRVDFFGYGEFWGPKLFRNEEIWDPEFLRPSL